MPTGHRNPAQYHYGEAEQILSTIGSLGATPEEATREVGVALVHAVLAIAAALTSSRHHPTDDQTAFGRDY